MAQPKKKLSRRTRGHRRGHLGLRVRSLSACPQCHEAKIPHRVCPNCGSYKRRQVIATEEI